MKLRGEIRAGNTNLEVIIKDKYKDMGLGEDMKVSVVRREKNKRLV